MFSFTRLRGADPTLGVEMSSTGEVACFGKDVQEAFLQALLATNFKLPDKSPIKYILVSIADEKMQSEFMESLEQLIEMGYKICATPGTAEYYKERGFDSIVSLDKSLDAANTASESNTVLNWIRQRRIDLVINVPEGTSGPTKHDEVTAGYLMRRAAVDYGCSLITNIK